MDIIYASSIQLCIHLLEKRKRKIITYIILVHRQQIDKFYSPIDIRVWIRGDSCNEQDTARTRFEEKVPMEFEVIKNGMRMSFTVERYWSEVQAATTNSEDMARKSMFNCPPSITHTFGFLSFKYCISYYYRINIL